MKIALKINWIITTLLNIATGLFKILQQPADIASFETIRFNQVMVTVLGILQLARGLTLMISKTRKMDAYLMIPTFILASFAVFTNNMLLFGFVSLFFIGMVYLVIVNEKKFNGAGK